MGDKLWYSTGEIAVLLEVSHKTVAKWIDEGILKGVRIGKGTHRRVLRGDLIAFMKENQVPLHILEKKR